MEMAKKTRKKKRTRKQKIAWYNREINFNIKTWFLILIVSIPVLLIVTQTGLWTFGIRWDFSSESAKVYFDYIQKFVYYMDTTDITEVFHGFKIEYNPV